MTFSIFADIALTILSDSPPPPDSGLAFIMEPSGCYLCDIGGMLLGGLVCPGLPLLFILIMIVFLTPSPENGI